MIRHGETEWSRDHRHTGRTDLPLTPRGRENARALGDRLRRIQFTRVLTSPLQRARVTCELAGLGGVAEIVPDLREWDCGEYEGLTLDEILASRPGWNLFREGCPGGESPADIDARVDAVIATLRQSGGTVGLFSHSHLLCALAARWIDLSAKEGGRFRLDTASYGVLSYEHNSSDEPSIIQWNA